MEQITNSYNLFIDSSRAHDSNSKGDDFLVNLQDAGVHAGEGEIIRMTLDNFSMAKNFNDVNATNNVFRYRNTDTQAVVDVTKNLTPKNYTSYNDLANEFAIQVRQAIVESIAVVNNAVIENPLPATTGSTNKVISFDIRTRDAQNADVAHGLTANNTIIQFNADVSDSYLLLGGDKTFNGDDTTSSVTITMPTTSLIRIVCKYPAQKSTMPFIYIRAPGVLNTNIETKGLRNHASTHKSDTAHSDILGRVVVASDDWVQYTAQTGREFFLDIHQKQLNHLRLKLTDASNRSLPITQFQNTKGNISFSAVIRFDIIKKRHPQHLESEHFVPSVAPRFSNGVLNKLDNGRDAFFKPPGY